MNSSRLKNKFFALLLIIFVIVGITTFLTRKEKNKDDFEVEREKVLSRLYFNIEKAKAEGKYKCCIEPACTMCYLGSWVWQDGSCYCQDMIVKGEWDRVCPQCLQGIKEGKCKSQNGVCPIL